MVHFHPQRIKNASDFIEAVQAEFVTEFNELEAQTGEAPPRRAPTHRVIPDHDWRKSFQTR